MKSQQAMHEEWLDVMAKLHDLAAWTVTEIERLREELRDAETLTAGAVRAESENNAVAWSRLREAAVAVGDAWKAPLYEDYNLAAFGELVETLRRVAGMKAPPQDGDAGDRADEAHERKGDR